MDGKDSFIERFLQSADSFTAEQVGQTAQLLLEHGIKWQASDIHIEPHETYAIVRYRVDGSLQNAHKMPDKAHRALTAHLKSRAALNNFHDATPQRGQFSATVDGQDYSIAIATMPVIGGEKVVLHVSARLNTPPALGQLGFWGPGLNHMRIALSRSHGLTIVSAPRHHGRPTTTASMINALQNPNLNIASVEDEVTYRLAHVNQTITNPHAGFSILQGLQAVLHLDPNVVLVGNVPDGKTAELAIQSALSGHLIIAGMHNDSASAALLHLRALGVPPYLIATGVKTVVSQRLVRQLCTTCRERYELSASQMAALQKAFGISSPRDFHRIHELETQAVSCGLGGDPRLSSSPTKITHLWKPRKGGCDECKHTGYRNRALLGEVLVVDEPVQRALNEPKQTAAGLQAIALKNPDFVPLALDGLIKSLRGLVAITDILHIVDRTLWPEKA